MTDCKIVVSGHGQETLFLAFVGNKADYLARAHAETGGGVFLGRVENYLQNLKAAFVRFNDHEIGYLPLEEVPQGVLYNRPYEKDTGLKAGDLLCVQMRQAAHGTKQAKLSAYLTLHGTFAVLGLEKKGVGCSKTLSNETRSILINACKERLYNAVTRGPDDPGTEKGQFPEDFPEHFGVILRTESGALYERFLAEGQTPGEALDKTMEAVLGDVAGLLKQMQSLVREGESRQPGSTLYKTGADARFHDRLLQVYHYLERTCPGMPVEIVCENDALYETACASELAAHEDVSIRVNRDVHAVYESNAILKNLTHRVVWLKCGAYLVIEETEAMTVVDVNSGKYTAKKDDDFLKVNLEAAEAVMREIRLRDLTGMIVVDFINMKQGESYAALKECLVTQAAADPVHTRFHDITALGLAEITRTNH